MKKLSITLAVVASILMVPTAFAASRNYVGENVAKLNVNVRSQPQMGNNLINHYKKGQTVIVTKQIGSWCKVQLKKYNKAYVYCPNLKPIENPTTQIVPVLATPSVPVTQPVQTPSQPTVPPTPSPAPAPTVAPNQTQQVSTQQQVQINEPAVDAISQVHSWLEINSRGINYINSSYDIAYKLAKSWDNNAKLYNVSVYSTQQGATHCVFLFASTNKVGVAYQAKCKSLIDNQVQVAEVAKPNLDSAAKINTYTFDLPHLPLRNFVTDMIGPNGVVDPIKAYFMGTSKHAVNFNLAVKNYEINGGAPTLVWEAKMTQAIGSKAMTVYKDATTLVSEFRISRSM